MNKMIFYLILLLIATTVKGNNDMYISNPESSATEDDNVPDASFGAPVYGTPYRLGPFPYSYPAPPAVPLTPSYGNYLPGLAINNPYSYPYDKYNYQPYFSLPSLRYTVALQNGLKYGFQSGLGNSGILSPFVDGTSYSGVGGLANPPYASNFLYPYSGFGYTSAFARPVAVVRPSAPSFPVRYSLPAASDPVPSNTRLPPTIAYSPSVPVSGPSVYQPTISYAPNVPAPLPPAPVPYRPDVSPGKGKDESIRYNYREQQ